MDNNICSAGVKCVINIASSSKGPLPDLNTIPCVLCNSRRHMSCIEGGCNDPDSFKCCSGYKYIFSISYIFSIIIFFIGDQLTKLDVLLVLNVNDEKTMCLVKTLSGSIPLTSYDIVPDSGAKMITTIYKVFLSHM